MNDKQRKIFKVFLFFECAVLLATTGVISLALYQKDPLAEKADIFHGLWMAQLENIHNLAWVLPVLVLLVGIGVAGIVLSIGLWRIYKTPK